MNLKKNLDLLIRANKQAIKEIFRNRQLYIRSSVDYSNIYEEVHNNSSPCFVLSTGRCGTHLLTKLLLQHKQLEVYHEPVPSLVYYSKYAYDNSESKYDEIKTAVDAARYEYIRDAYLLNMQYVETNNRITFFAKQIAELYPQSKFIHLVRNPLTFVKSGINRDWYSGKNSHDEGRIRLQAGEWENFSDAKKIAWLWEKTNKFIENFKQEIPENRALTIRSEDLFSNQEYAASIFKFLEVEPLNKSKIEAVIGKPTNVSKKGKSSVSLNELKEEVKGIITLNEKYGYKLT